ncbi:MAG: BglG family transcription antiterminator [Traorella sp.]
MKSDNIKQLISILQNENDWISGSELSKLIHVDKKTIRNYIQEINNEKKYIIESSPKGYKLTKSNVIENFSQERSKFILYRLLANKNGVSLFDLAEEFYVSESTIMNDVTTQIKDEIAPYHLDIISRDFTLYLIGNENDKRKLIGFIATHNSNGYFSSTETLQNLAPSIDVNQIGDKLKEFCNETHLPINSYALNNLLIHLIIIIIRLNSNESLPEIHTYSNDLLENNPSKEDIIQFANKIRNYCFELTHNQMPINDYQQILLLVSISIENIPMSQIELDIFSSLMDKDFFNNVIHDLIKLANKYNLDDFDNEFICQFYLHSYNLYQRAKYDVSYPNPLAKQIKKEYAPVYDMAVYYAHLLSKQYNIHISEDEIGFIAFHIGSYLESHQPKSKKISVLIICEDYHLSARRFIHELHMSFGEELTVTKMIPVSQYNESMYSDLIISTTYYDFHHNHVVYVNPIITKKNILTIHDEIQKIELEKKHQETLDCIRSIFNKDFYFKNVYLDSCEDYIRFLCQEPLKKNIIDASFIDDVLLREKFSSTAFTDQVALPHSITVNSNESFIAILHNNTPFKWNKKQINFILLIGVTAQDMTKFRDIFDLIIDSFLSIEKTVQLLKTSSFEEFIQVLTK